MSLPAIIIVGLALLAFAGFLVLALGLFTQGRDLYRSANAFREEVAPTVAEITRGGEEAQRKSVLIQERLATLQEVAGALQKARSRGRR